jgi:ABC-type transporter Mla MlaB component
VGIPAGLLHYTPIFAHFGHWYVSLPVFGAPVVIIAVAVKVSERRERRRARAGDSSRLRVAVSEEQGQTILRVCGKLDYPTLLDIEHELDRVVPRAPRILLDLSSLREVEEEDFAWSLTEIVNRIESAEVTLLIGEAPALRELSKVSALEGLKLAAADSRSS